ncbi:putative peptidyl-prolyl cis-trans isomerase pin4 [Blumeria hordei DH14]|uniref:Putative peptidyl-prolyl cis-trans isomerase pin4 n=1 Tax=Blumeria graminis f. sp. hordei (strain DH14) TaxID=546991 RepID=N1JAW7_BLUG1|nr:putative peptidyl-prolyl cis-trans isomerase pin4 [Blumeria hordei DH14]
MITRAKARAKKRRIAIMVAEARSKVLNRSTFGTYCVRNSPSNKKRYSACEMEPNSTTQLESFPRTRHGLEVPWVGKREVISTRPSRRLPLSSNQAPWLIPDTWKPKPSMVITSSWWRVGNDGGLHFDFMGTRCTVIRY